MGITTLTPNPAVDVSTSVPQVVADRKLRCAAPAEDPGGGGVNVSRAIANLGGTSRAVYPAGGPAGQRLRALLGAEDIDDVHIDIAGDTRQSLTVTEETTGRQFRFGFPGPALDDDELARCLDAAVAGRGYLVFSGSLPPGVPHAFVARVAGLARSRSLRLVVDTSGPALRQAVEVGAFLVKPNLGELASLAGRDDLEEDAAARFAEELVASGSVQAVLLSLGAVGALLVAEGGVRARLRPPAVRVRSRVGAGDSTVAGMVLALHRGDGLVEAARYAVACGTAAVLTDGTQLCRRSDVERLAPLVEVS